MICAPVLRREVKFFPPMGLRLIGNASALQPKECCSVILKKMFGKGSLASLASQNFPDARRNLFGEAFVRGTSRLELKQPKPICKLPMLVKEVSLF